MITTIVNVFSTPISFYTMEKIGRRPLLLWGALGMVICQFIVAIAGVVDGQNPQTVSAQISFICIYICTYYPHSNICIVILTPSQSSSPLLGALVLGLLLAKFTRCPSVRAVLLCRPPLTGSGTASSPLLLHTWSTQIRAISSPRCFLSGALYAPAPLSTPTS